jgi:SagB-type dehydrogenase family enzyme
MQRLLAPLVLAMVLIALGLGALFLAPRPQRQQASNTEPSAERIALPSPDTGAEPDGGSISLERALAERRSERDYVDRPLTLAELGQLLWAAQGITDARGYRTAPSAGALYPLEVYVVVGQVEGLEQGVYRYLPDDHSVIRTGLGDRRQELAAASLNQTWVADGAVTLVIAAVYERITVRYGARGDQYVHMEIGHAAQNVYLQAAGLRLGTVMVGAFHDDRVSDVVGLPQDHEPLAIMPVGRLR